MEYFLVLLQDKLLVLIGQPALHLASHRRQLIPLGLLVVLGVVDDILGRCAVISQHIQLLYLLLEPAAGANGAIREVCEVDVGVILGLALRRRIVATDIVGREVPLGPIPLSVGHLVADWLASAVEVNIAACRAVWCYYLLPLRGLSVPKYLVLC